MLVRATVFAFVATIAFSAPALAQADPHHPDATAPEVSGNVGVSPDMAASPPAGCPPVSGSKWNAP